jgi:phytoene dehydrogenase-like protein
VVADGATDYDAVVIGAGHNGLVCAAYLVRGGLTTLLLEARDTVGGTASSETFAGATVNICSCDHITFRTTPIAEELGLADHGLRYLDVEPSQLSLAWSGGPAWPLFHDVDETLDALARTYPREVDGYRRYLRAAMPAVRLVFEAANDPPSVGGLARKLLSARGRGAGTLLRWSRRTAADVIRSYFRADALQGPAIVAGPMVWGISPETPGSGVGALSYAVRHVGMVGRPVGGSGRVPETLLAAFLAGGGELRTGSKVERITCEGDHVRGVALADGIEVRAARVVSACNPHDTFLHWLTDPPPQARDLVRRWRTIPSGEGYESKIDGVIARVPELRALPEELRARLGERASPTIVVAPSLDDIHRGARLMKDGAVLDRPGFLVNVPSALDPTMAPPGGDAHVFSLEVLFTPYGLRGGWPASSEPKRWLDQFATLCEGDFEATLGQWRAMTPDRYEREFHLPAGHASSFAGGPLAAFHNANPELTKYETAVRGLYLTGAATFPGAGIWGASGRNAATVILRGA